MHLRNYKNSLPPKPPPAPLDPQLAPPGPQLSQSDTDTGLFEDWPKHICIQEGVYEFVLNQSAIFSSSFNRS